MFGCKHTTTLEVTLVSSFHSLMRLSLEEEVPAGPSRAAPEMQQTGSLHTLVDPLTNRPKVYYGDGPFDASSSESEDERTVNALEDDEDEEMENRSLLSGGKPPTPGRAEMGDSRSRRHDVEPAVSITTSWVSSGL